MTSDQMSYVGIATQHTNGSGSLDSKSVPSKSTIAQPSVPFAWRKHVRWWRVLSALVGAALILWVTVRYVIIPIWLPNGVGVTNMRSTLVRSPLDGTVKLAPIELGTVVQAGDLIATLTNDLVDESTAQRLTTRREELKSHLVRLADERIRVEATRAAAQRSLKSHQAALVKTQEKVSLELHENIEMAKVNQSSSVRTLELERRLFKDHATTLDQLWSAFEATKIAALTIDQRKASLERAEAELAASRSGVILNMSPFHLQLEEQMSIRLSGIDIEIAENSRLLSAVEVELAAATNRVRQLAHAEVRSPFKGIIIRRMVLGGTIPRHEPLFEIAEPKVFVEAVIYQGCLNRLATNCLAIINVTGGRTLEGRVRGIRLSGTGDVEPSNVSRIPRRPDQVSVLIDLDEFEATPELASRHCEVLILDREPGWLQCAARKLFSFRLWPKN